MNILKVCKGAIVFLLIASLVVAIPYSIAEASSKPQITQAYFDSVNGKCYLYLTWKTIKNAEQYKVYYYNTKSKSVLLGTSSSNTFVTSDLDSGVYKVYVSAETKKSCIDSNTTKTKPYKKATAINLSVNRNNIICGNSKTIAFSFKPSDATKNSSPIKEISWMSSDTSIATVDNNGVVTASESNTGKVVISAINKTTGIESSITLYIHKYNIFDAVKYSDDHVYDGVGKCATFVSHCLNAGGINVFDDNPVGLKDLLLNSNNGWKLVKNPSKSQIKKGDVVLYFVPSKKTSGWAHVTFCVGVKNGVPIVNSHNKDRLHVNYNYYGGGSTIYVLQVAD